MEILIVSEHQPRRNALESGIPWTDMGIDRIYTASSVHLAKKWMMAHPLHLLLADYAIGDEVGLDLIEWAAQAGMTVYTILLAEGCDLALARRAIELGVFRLLSTDAPLQEVKEAVLAATDAMERRRVSVYEYTQGELNFWHHAVAEAKKLDVFLTSGANLQDILHEGILPKDRQLHLLRIKIPSWGKSERWSDRLAQMALMNLARQVFSVHWSLSPVVPMENDTYACFLWACETVPPEVMEAELDQFYTLSQKRLDCVISLKKEGPFSVREAPEKWRLITADDLPGSAEALSPPQKGKTPPPEVQLWADILLSKQPKFLMSHLHKYIASRWNGMPPTQEELQQLYLQFLQAVDIAMGDKNLWSEVLMDADKYEKYIHGARSLEAYFSFALMTVQEFVKLQNAGEISLVEHVNLFLEEHLEEKIQCADIAAAFLTNPDYLNRQFKRQTGRTLKEYITEYKMMYAHRLLRLTRLPVSVVAAKVGYENFSHFSTVYKKSHGISPIETRKSGQ